MGELILKRDRDKSILRHHPWIFSGAVNKVIGEPAPGETVVIKSSTGEFLASAAYNPKSNIIGRIWSWYENENIDRNFFKQRLQNAINSRTQIKTIIHSDAVRLVHGESDGLPGLILDQYKDTLVVQFLTAGVEFWRETLVDSIIKITGARALYERSDQDVRELEGLPLVAGLLFGDLPDNKITIIENKLKFLVDIENGHKTGSYLDQKDNHLFTRLISKDLNVLDCFSYTGGFGINALAGGAKSVRMVDSSRLALDMAKQNVILNNLDLQMVRFVEEDVFKYLRFLRDSNEQFDLIILDPPKFAPTSAQVERASRGYKDINLLAFKLLKNDGYLLSFSCSGGVSEELFQKVVSGAALDAGCNAVIIKRLHQAIDHPVALNFPEGAYLKGFFIQKRQ